MILDKIRNLLRREEIETDSRRHAFDLAGVVLLVEIASADFSADAVELDTISKKISARQGLSYSEARALLEDAVAEHEQSVSLHDYVKCINKGASRAEKEQLVGDLWEVAYADGVLDEYEESQLRKISELLHVSHTRFIQSKWVARKRLPGSAG